MMQQAFTQLRANAERPSRKRVVVGLEPRSHASGDDNLPAKTDVTDLSADVFRSSDVKSLACHTMCLHDQVALLPYICVVDTHTHSNSAEKKLWLETDSNFSLHGRN
ncbi:hypothetical protein GQ600_9969 [Phytophthora cactorum]|nr:hypothetical protein GQ600_9969 [Phytophthora cactorum]